MSAKVSRLLEALHCVGFDLILITVLTLFLIQDLPLEALTPLHYGWTEVRNMPIGIHVECPVPIFLHSRMPERSNNSPIRGSNPGLQRDRWGCLPIHYKGLLCVFVSSSCGKQ